VVTGSCKRCGRGCIGYNSIEAIRRGSSSMALLHGHFQQRSLGFIAQIMRFSWRNGRVPVETMFATVRHRTIRSKGWLSNKTALAEVSRSSMARRQPGDVSTDKTCCQNSSPM
jgi:hypothetical protein